MCMRSILRADRLNLRGKSFQSIGALSQICLSRIDSLSAIRSSDFTLAGIYEVRSKHEVGKS